MYEFYQYEDPTASEVWDNCVVPSIKDIFPKVRDIFVYNLLFNLITQTLGVLPNTLFHLVSFSTGVCLLFSIVKENIGHFLCFLLSVYVFMYVIYHLRSGMYSLNFTGIACITYLLLCELYYDNQQSWMQVRGLFMIGAMKIISLSFDLQYGCELPSLVAFFGYTCCPANSIFGPWISYKEYFFISRCPQTKNLKWVQKIIVTTSMSLFFLTISNCWGSYLIPDDAFTWLLAYRQAQSFRTSHYFISYMSEATMVMAGYSDEKQRSDNLWGYQITRPWDIEIPSSLVSVVVSWNIPMHKFLKKYVYRACLQIGHFKAILATYFVSSLLHGFNIEIAAVLLTIGLYSYIQLKFQDKLSTQLNACLRVRPCRLCQHRYRRSNIFVMLAHVMFSLLTVFNLIYLGILMDYVGFPDSLSVYSKWENLNFLSHWVMLVIHIYTVVN